ncbi:LacI family transcriptional regulator, partial [Listeria welshimeri]|nr:LacI family transcriptional regulator [Listeria welshimeri]
LIIASPNILASKVFERLQEKKKPYILLDRQRNEQKEGRIAVDDFEGGYMATKHLQHLGHTKIGIIISDNSFYNVFERYEGYLACMKESGITVSKDWIVSGNQTMQGGFLAGEKLLESGVTAVFATNDLMAVGLYRFLFDKGVKIPEDLSVIGFDDIELSEFMVPPLTTVRQPIYEIGA